MSLFAKHKEKIERAIQAVHERTFYAGYPEHPKAYGVEAFGVGEAAFKATLNSEFQGLLQTGATGANGEEESPYWGMNLGISYPTVPINTLIDNAQTAFDSWRKTSVNTRAGLLVESLERLTKRFHEIAYATQHTTGQSFVMSYQASGPHAADRALETIAVGYHELTRFPKEVHWVKPMGRFAVKLDKTFQPIPKGIGLVIGCSTFPTWNTVPGLYADLITGNVAIVKPHPKAVLPIAIFVAELQQVLAENGHDPNVVQLAVDSSDDLIAKKLAEHKAVSLIDYTGGSVFGSYIESLKDKTTFTEKAGVNSVILDSADDLRNVMRNLAFSVSLYSGQMCTAPQNFFIPTSGVKTANGEVVAYKQVVDLLKNEVASLVLHPKRGAGTLGAIQNPATQARAVGAKALGGMMVLEAPKVKSAEFDNARIQAPTIIEVDAADKTIYEQELFGPVILIVKTRDTDESIALAKAMAAKHGAITCAAYSTDEATTAKIVDEMNQVFTPVSLNFVGFIFVNQHAAFSDFHVTGGNPAGNASFTDPAYINKRFVWVGNRWIQ